MGKVLEWIKAVVAATRPYSAMGGIDIQKSRERIFPSSEETSKKEPENKNN